MHVYLTFKNLLLTSTVKHLTQMVFVSTAPKDSTLTAMEFASRYLPVAKPSISNSWFVDNVMLDIHSKTVFVSGIMQLLWLFRIVLKNYREYV